MISKDQEAVILRLHDTEHWPIGTITTQLRVHHETVERVVERGSQPKAAIARPSKFDPYVEFIKETFAKYPTLCASRLFQMCKDRGMTGSESHFRHFVQPLRPRPVAEAYQRLKTLPGEQAQVDWGHFGKLVIGAATRMLLAFVMVLSYSRRIFLRFFLGAQTENFLRGHDAAFTAFGGVPRVVLYDNLKSCVLERHGSAVRYNELLLAFASHHRYEPRPVAVARGNEKGRVERAILYIRRSFFAARQWSDLDDLNRQAEEWCLGPAMERRWPEDDRKTVAEAFDAERSYLLALPANPFPTDERREIPVRKTPYLRFDGNDYSVPHDRTHRTLTVVASLCVVRIFDGTELVAEHARSFGRHEQIEDPRHIAGLLEMKQRAKQHRGTDRLARAAPSTRLLLIRLADRGENLGSATSRLLRLLDEFGGAALEHAVLQALEHPLPHHRVVRHILEQERRQAGAPPLIPVELPDDPRIRDLSVTPHALETYDRLANPDEKEDDDDCCAQVDAR